MGTNIIHMGEPLYLSYELDYLVWNEDNTTNFSNATNIIIYKDGEPVTQINPGSGFSFVKRSDIKNVLLDISITDTSFLNHGDYEWKMTIRDRNGNIIKEISDTFIVLDKEKRDIERNVKPWDLINDKRPKASYDIAEFRYSICKSCERFKAGVCLECGCIMKLKTTLAEAHCPLHKWGTI